MLKYLSESNGLSDKNTIFALTSEENGMDIAHLPL